MQDHLEPVHHEEALRMYGASIALMLHELDLPQSVKDLLLNVLELLEPHQMFQFADLIETAFYQQMLVAHDNRYQSDATGVDQETIIRLQALLDEK